MLSGRVFGVGDFIWYYKMMKPLSNAGTGHLYPKSVLFSSMKSISYGNIRASATRGNVDAKNSQYYGNWFRMGLYDSIQVGYFSNCRPKQGSLLSSAKLASTVRSLCTSTFFNNSASPPGGTLTQDESEEAFPSVTLTRLIFPADTQMLGMIHGGILLGLIEEAGNIAATKYCNRYLDVGSTEKTGPVVAVLASVQQADFLFPMKLGEMVELQAQVTYTSQRSLEVTVNVYGTHALTLSSRKLTNRSVLWYVPINVADPDSQVKIYPLPSTNRAAYARSHSSYVERKLLRESVSSRASLKTTCLKTFALPGVPESSASSSYIIHPIHCGGTLPRSVASGDGGGCWQICKGGVLLRWMDDITGAYVISHCGTACVTASIDSAEFYSMLPVGSYVTILVRPVFSSKRTVDMLATAYVEDFTSKHVEYRRVAEAFYTFALYGTDSNPDRVEMIPSVIEADNEEDQKMFEARKKRYLKRKEAAAAAKKPSK